MGKNLAFRGLATHGEGGGIKRINGEKFTRECLYRIRPRVEGNFVGRGTELKMAER